MGDGAGSGHRRDGTIDRAFPAEPVELKAVADYVEVVLSCDPFPQLDHFIGSELDDSPTPPTEHVIVRVLAEGVLVVGLLDVETDLLKDAAVHQQGQRPVHRRLPDVKPPLFDGIDNLLGLEVLVHVEHHVEELPPWTGELDPVIAEVLAECLPRLIGTVNVR